jgi:hypothetical protein
MVDMGDTPNPGPSASLRGVQRGYAPLHSPCTTLQIEDFADGREGEIV